MQSKIADSVGLQTHPVALVWADSAPEAALQFKPGRWGCVMSLFATVAAKGKTGVFDRQTYGCWGGGVGLGFGNRYETFPGGLDGFYGFLSDGNEKSEIGRQIGQGLAQAGATQLADDFLLGERYVRDPECTKKFLQTLPIRDVPTKYIVVKPLEQTDSEKDDIKSVTFFVEPDALSALVVLANYAQPELENVAIPWAAACQVLGILGYRELEREHPRALVGLTDISARRSVRSSLGKHVLSFTAPWPLFLEMEKHAKGSFLERKTWRSLHR
jgi:uncharacterized protein (DUF169 family)